MGKKAIIVGAGIGGLAAGKTLRADGWNVKLLERAAALPSTGTALAMWPQAMAALDRLGVGDHVREQGVLQHGGSLLRPDGSSFARIVSKAPIYLVSRPVLHRILYQDSLEDCVEWTTHVINDDSLPEADLIVGADGINSRVRDSVAGRKLDPRPLGTVALRGGVPGSVSSVSETWGEGRLFGITPQDDETTNWFACLREDLLIQSGALSDGELLTALYGDWHPAVAEVVRKVDPDKIDRRVLYDSAPLGSLVRGHTVVIGDAAHAMAPNAGRGACEALIDAVALADCLHSSSTIQHGLQAFDRRRRRRGQRIVQVSRVLNRLSTARRFTGLRQRTMGVLARLA